MALVPRVCVLLLCLVPCTSCGAFLGRVESKEFPQPFAGVRWDSNKMRWPPRTAQHYLVFVDLPFSLAVDVALLPIEAATWALRDGLQGTGVLWPGWR